MFRIFLFRRFEFSVPTFHVPAFHFPSSSPTPSPSLFQNPVRNKCSQTKTELCSNEKTVDQLHPLRQRCLLPKRITISKPICGNFDGKINSYFGEQGNDVKWCEHWVRVKSLTSYKFSKMLGIFRRVIRVTNNRI